MEQSELERLADLVADRIGRLAPVFYPLDVIGAQLSVHPRTIQRRVATGELPPLEEFAGVNGYTPQTMGLIQARARDRAGR